MYVYTHKDTHAGYRVDTSIIFIFLLIKSRFGIYTYQQFNNTNSWCKSIETLSFVNETLGFGGKFDCNATQ